MTTSFMHSLHTRLSPTSLLPPIPLPSSFLSHGCPQSTQSIEGPRKTRTSVSGRSRRARGIACGFLPVDPWAPTIDSQSIATQLFAFSLFPYLGFLYFITKSSSTPKLTLFGFYFLLAFVGATTKVSYGTSLSNVDWLHGGAESLLTLTNLFVVLGLRKALRQRKD